MADPELVSVCSGLPSVLPPPRPLDTSVPHAPQRRPDLSKADQRLAIENALRYFPPEQHAELAGEFQAELSAYGHVYVHRLRPEIDMGARPIASYPAACPEAAAIMLMIMNNLDPAVAQYPHELVTYGGNGSVLSNWAQFRIVMHLLSVMTREQTLILSSGHPLGLFPSHPDAPRLVITNGLMVPHYSTREQYERLYALGATQYGQMTAGSFCYIGPQGIVHGTTLTLLNAGRKYLGVPTLSGKVFVSSGLGGMSGAQGKAALVSGAIGVIAEVDPHALHKRHEQGWIEEVVDDLDELVSLLRARRAAPRACAIGFLGNVVDVWERLADEEDLLVDLGSDQTSLHNPFGGGYYPVGMSFEEGCALLQSDAAAFRAAVERSLRRHAAALLRLAARGMRFWDYGNSFLLEASRAGAAVLSEGSAAEDPTFVFPSYVQDIMGDIFSLGFGPFRWVCAAGDPADLHTTDTIAGDVLEGMAGSAEVSAADRGQLEDNLLWIRRAEENRLVVGSQARILYANAPGRVAIAEAFNTAVAEGRLSGPVVLSRDHHDTGGADSPWRETSNVTDGSKFTADMSFHTVVGNAVRGATWVAMHNGGGTGWGEASNCGFGLVLDGSASAARRARAVLSWDVSNGVARRAWARHPLAEQTARAGMAADPSLRITLPHHADPALLDRVCGPLP